MPVLLTLFNGINAFLPYRGFFGSEECGSDGQGSL